MLLYEFIYNVYFASISSGSNAERNCYRERTYATNYISKTLGKLTSVNGTASNTVSFTTGSIRDEMFLVTENKPGF